jgi:phosphatidylglycerophosphatase A
LGWAGLLLATGNVWSLLLGTLCGLAASVWLCGYAEKCLGEKDPGSVVLDEIAAMPACFGSWIALYLWKNGSIPRLDFSFLKSNWLPILAVFVAFRIFDIWKPWPVRQSQSLPAGWGITLDDLLAAVYVNFIALVMAGIKLA